MLPIILNHPAYHGHKKPQTHTELELLTFAILLSLNTLIYLSSEIC